MACREFEERHGFRRGASERRGAWGALRGPHGMSRIRGAPRLRRGASERRGAWGALRGPPSQLILDEGAEVAAAQGVAELPERLGLDLPDTLARHLEALPDLFEGVLALFADAEAQAQDLLFLRGEHRQGPLDLRGEVLVEQRLVGRAGGL